VHVDDIDADMIKWLESHYYWTIDIMTSGEFISYQVLFEDANLAMLFKLTFG